MSCDGWKEIKLGEVVKFKRGYDLPKKKRETGEYPVIASNGIVDFHNDFKVKGPGVITGRSGTLGEVFYLKKDFWPLNTTLYVEDFFGNNEKFVYYFLKTIDLANYNAGSSVPTLNRNHIHSLPVIVPSVNKQRKIARILSSFDDKIELNHQINQDLEEMAQAIFKSWFVDFEPFRDGEFVDSELGLIPKGWRVDKLGNVCTVTGGGTPKTKMPDYWENGDILWATPSDMTSKNSMVLFDTSRKITELGLQNSSAKLLPKGSVLMTSRATIGYTSIAMKEVSTNQGFINIVCNKQISNYYMLCYLRYFKDRILRLANGSTFMEVSKRNFKEINVVVPPYNLIEKFNQYIEPIIGTIYQHEQQNQILSNLRDTLLPKLMSGEIRV